MGAMIIGPESLKLEPGPPKKVKKWFQWYFWLSGTHMGSQKIFVDFRDGVSESVHR